VPSHGVGVTHRWRCHQESAPAVKASGQGSGEKKAYTARAEFCQQDHGPGEGNFLSIVPPLMLDENELTSNPGRQNLGWYQLPSLLGPPYTHMFSSSVYRSRSLFPRTGHCRTTWVPQLHNKPKNEIILNHFASAIAIYVFFFFVKRGGEKNCMKQ
jgi:hypothetical protein